MNGPFATNADMQREKEERQEPPREPREPLRAAPLPRTIPSSREIMLSAAIMAHPARAAQVERLQAKLDREVPVVWDQLHDRWDTGRRSMLAADPDCTHHLVLQDDVLIPHDLLAGLELALAYIPEGAPLVGYVGRLRPQNDRVKDLVELADRKGASWITMRQIHWGPLIVVPTASVAPMIEFCDVLETILNYDLRLSRYWEEWGIRAWYTWPCLVDHADGPSLVPGRSGVDRKRPQPSRVAHKFCGEEISALDIDWSGPMIRGR